MKCEKMAGSVLGQRRAGSFYAEYDNAVYDVEGMRGFCANSMADKSTAGQSIPASFDKICPTNYVFFQPYPF